MPIIVGLFNSSSNKQNEIKEEDERSNDTS